ncbi:MAG: protein kinase [Planctomycetota bacterium]
MSDASPQARDALFALFAVKLGLVSEAAVERALGRGEGKSLRAALIEAGKLTPEQADRVEAALDPEVIAGYRIEGEAGRGGMGVVYRARQLSMDRVVALKVLTRRLSRDAAYVAKFLAEARSAAKLNHENIVAAIDAGESQGLHYFAMEFVDGASVADVMERDGPLAWERAFEVVEQIGRALEHAHQAGLVHRDVKPENVLLHSDGQAKLCDLGLAKPSEVAGTGEKAAMTEGTPYYCSPEQALGRTDIDPRSDVYSLGVTLYTMILGAPPFDGDTPRAILLKQVKEPFPDLAEKLPQVPGPLREVISAMVVKDREQRLAGMRDLFERLNAARGEAARGGAVAPGRRLGRIGGRSLAPALAGLAVVVLAVVALAVASTKEDPTGPSPSPSPSEVASASPSPTPKASAGPVRVSPSPSASAGSKGDARLRAAKEAFDAAVAYQQQSPGDQAGQRQRFQQVIETYPGTGYASQAEVRVASLADAAQRNVTRALDALSEQVLDRLGRGDVRGALELIQTFRQAWGPKKVPGLSERVETIEGRVRQQALLKVEEQLALLEAGKATAQTRGEVEALLALVPGEVAERARGRLAAIERALARSALDAVDREVEGALRRGDVDGARARLDQASADPALAAFAGVLRRTREDVDAFGAAKRAFEARLAKLPREARVDFALQAGGRAEGRYLDFDALTLRGRFQDAKGGDPHDLPLRDLSPSTLVSWVLPPAQGRGNVLLFLTRDLADAAAEAYARYKAGGGEHDPELEARIARARARRADELAGQALEPLLAPEAAAEVVLTGIRALPPEVRKAASYKARFEELKAAYVRARLAQIQGAEEALFHAAEAKKDKRGRITLLYDFTSEAQLLDWTPLTKELPKSTRKLGDKAMVAVGAVRLEALFEAGLLKFEFRVTERSRDKPNVNVLINPGEALWEGVLCGAGFHFGELANLKIDTGAKKQAGYIVDLPAHVLIALEGQAPSRRMTGVLAATTKPDITKGAAFKVSLTRSEKSWLKLKIGSRNVFNQVVEQAERPGRLTLAPLESELAITEVEVWGRLEAKWVEERARAVADAEAAALPAPE